MGFSDKAITVGWWYDNLVFAVTVFAPYLPVPNKKLSDVPNELSVLVVGHARWPFHIL
jgi:hypothetical protein